MEVAVVAVWVVERPRDLVIHVVSVRDGDVPARNAVLVAAFDGRASAGTPPVHVQPMLVRVLFVGGVEVAVMQVIDVVAVWYGPVTAIGSVHVAMAIVFPAGHDSSPAVASSLRDHAAVKLVTCS